LAYLGNYEPPHSTENDVAATLEGMGHAVLRLQEQRIDDWERLFDLIGAHSPPDIILWTRTRSLADQIGHERQRWMQFAARKRGIPVVGLHLDRWRGLAREYETLTEPFFRCDYVFTADGHDSQDWIDRDINHRWSLPAIAPHNTQLGVPRDHFRSDIAFVGGWDGYGHTEWFHRRQLVEFLQTEYGDRVQFWPKKGQHAIRGVDLADLYASVKVVVGDSCLVPDADGSWTRYCSDRVFETIGRGAYLIHPYVDGVISEKSGTALQAGKHLGAWRISDWGGLRDEIDEALDDPEARDIVAKAGYEHVRENHTYRNRLEALINEVT
jgi:hypothetical protein